MLLGGRKPTAGPLFSPYTFPEYAWHSSPRSLTRPTVFPWLTERSPGSGHPGSHHRKADEREDTPVPFLLSLRL